MKSIVQTLRHPAWVTLAGSVLSYTVLLVVLTLLLVVLPYFINLHFL